MTNKVSSKRPREDLKPRPLPVAEKMLPYADRIKLRANEPAGPSQREAVEVMADILAKKKIPAGEATWAIREARDAAETNQLAPWYFENRRGTAANALKDKDLDDLILEMEELASAIAILPPISKAHLNWKTAQLVKEGFFDTEVLFELISLLRDCLPGLSPQKNADDLRRIIEQLLEGESSPRIGRLWEGIPAITRNRVERRIEQRIKNSRSLSSVELIRGLPELLRDFRPTRRGAPRFLLQKYVRDIHRIWLRLNLTARRNYYVGSKRVSDKDRHVQSLFQKFCNAALTSVGDPTEISIRQVSNLKRDAPLKGKPRK
jgi:hypothetical protein